MAVTAARFFASTMDSRGVTILSEGSIHFGLAGHHRYRCRRSEACDDQQCADSVTLVHHLSSNGVVGFRVILSLSLVVEKDGEKGEVRCRAMVMNVARSLKMGRAMFQERGD
jgi:hypothetical protein